MLYLYPSHPWDALPYCKEHYWVCHRGKGLHRYAPYTSRSGFAESDWLIAKNSSRKSAWRQCIRNGDRSSISEQTYISIQLRGHLDRLHRKSYNGLVARQLQAFPNTARQITETPQSRHKNPRRHCCCITTCQARSAQRRQPPGLRLSILRKHTSIHPPSINHTRLRREWC